MYLTLLHTLITFAHWVSYDPFLPAPCPSLSLVPTYSSDQLMVIGNISHHTQMELHLPMPCCILFCCSENYWLPQMTCPMLRYKIKSKVNGRSHWKEIKDGNKNPSSEHIKNHQRRKKYRTRRVKQVNQISFYVLIGIKINIAPTINITTTHPLKYVKNNPT